MIRDELIISVCMITYNHEDYIRQAIDSVVNQKCNYNIELVIGDDFSTDNTKLICDEYIEKYPDWIRVLPSEKNLGAIPNFIRTLESCKGKYISFCEGDDFWIDPFKLQKQVDFLEANQSYSLCFHDAIVFWEDKAKPPYYFCRKLSKSTYQIEDVIKGWLMPSASMVFRKELLLPLPHWFIDVYNGDYALQLLLALKGEFYFINQIMSVYRRNNVSLSSNVKAGEINNNVIKLLELYNEYTNHKYNNLIKKTLYKRNSSLNIIKVKNLVRLMVGKKVWSLLIFKFSN